MLELMKKHRNHHHIIPRSIACLLNEIADWNNLRIGRESQYPEKTPVVLTFAYLRR